MGLLARLGSIGCLSLLGLPACSDDVPATSTDASGSTTESQTNTTRDPDTASTTLTTGTSETEPDGTTGTTEPTEPDGTTDTTEPTDTDTAPPPVCGNGMVEGDEACDDGGESSTCNVDCTPAGCGDGIFNATAGELCDEGGATPLCNADCTPAECGDGIVNAAAGEDCDDGGESTTCNVDCSTSACGDGITNATAGELCDDMGASLGCDDDCTPSACGDGFVNAAAGEDCDTEGATARCDADCTSALCGDGTLNALAGEACDGAELAGATCTGFGFDSGTLDCDLACAYDTGDCVFVPAAPVLTLSFSPVKRFDFTWDAVPQAAYYQLLESPAPGEPFVPLGGDVVGTSVSFELPLYARLQASYQLRACNAAGCTDSAVVDVTGSLAEAVGYVKASNPDANDEFGSNVALSGDGNTLAVSAPREDSNAGGINGSQNDISENTGAVYVFTRNGGAWSQQAYVKASSAGQLDFFGRSLVLSDEGNTLAVGAPYEASNATGINGNQGNNLADNAGAAYVFTRNGVGVWSQQAYVKASNTSAGDRFGWSVALSGDGDTLAVGAIEEDSGAIGIGGDQADNSVLASGAVYVYTRNGVGVWSQQAYVKASNPGEGDEFGNSVALSGDGSVLAVGTFWEDGNSTGIGGNQADGLLNSGAVYVLTRDGLDTWSQQAYVKASNAGGSDWFGSSVAMSGDGNTLAVGAINEDGNATGVGGNQADESASGSGAVYLY